MKAEIKTNIATTYYWYSSKKIFQTQGGYSGVLLEGKYIEKFVSGNIKCKGSIHNGSKHGQWFYWSEGGKLKLFETWKCGKKSGKFTVFSEQGKVIITGKFKKDKLNGTVSYFDSAGERTRSVHFKNGKEKHEIKHRLLNKLKFKKRNNKSEDET